MTEPPNGKVGTREFYGQLDVIKNQISQLRIAVGVLIVLTASPRVGGPSAPEVVAWAAGLLT